MTIIRDIIFTNDTAYTITGTLQRIHTVYTEMEDRFNWSDYDCICDTLINCRYEGETDFEKLIPHPITGVYEHFGYWLADWGVEDTMLDDITVDTFDMSDDESVYTGEEAITDDDEDILVLAANILFEMNPDASLDDASYYIEE